METTTDRAARARASRRWIWGLIALVVVVAALVIFEPWKLWIDKTVNEAAPGGIQISDAAAGDEGAGGAMDPGTGSAKKAQGGGDGGATVMGQFVSLAHEGRGTAFLIELDGGERFLRFEDFEVENGPDLVVLLSPEPADGGGAYDDGAYEVAGLKGNIGDQNYELPDDVELSKYRSVVIWCKPFGVAFAAAPLEG